MDTPEFIWEYIYIYMHVITINEMRDPKFKGEQEGAGRKSFEGGKGIEKC